MAEGLNGFFVSKVQNLLKGLPTLKATGPIKVPHMTLMEFSMEDLKKRIKKVKSTPAAGVDVKIEV